MNVQAVVESDGNGMVFVVLRWPKQENIESISFKLAPHGAERFGELLIRKAQDAYEETSMAAGRGE